MVGNEFRRLTAAAVCASLVGFAACSGRNGNGSTSDSATGATSRGEVAKSDSAASATAPTSSAAPSTATPGTPGGSTLSVTGGDPEIVQVLAVVDRGEVQDGQLAERQARSSQVKSYARELVSDHTKSLSQDRQLAKAVNADLSMLSGNNASGMSRTTDTTSKAASPTSAAASTSGTIGGVAAQLTTMHTQMMDQVKQQKGAAFDSAFVNAEVQGHQQVLDLLQRSQSQAQNPQVQQHVTAAIKDVQSHLERGQKLQQSLTSAAGMGNDSTSKSKKTGSDSATKKG